MNIRRILISEQEKKSILGLYGVDKDLVNEQEFKIDSDGTYTVKYNQEFSVTGQQFGGSPSRVQIKKGTKIKPKDGKLIFNVYYGTVSGVYDKISSGTYTCGNTSIIVGTTQQYGQVPPPGGFISTIRSLFCNGNKLKTDNKTTELNKKTGGTKCESVLGIPKDDQLCYLDGDKTYVYAKKDGEYYTSKQTDKKRWCKLSLPKWKTAVDKLVAGCRTLREIVAFIPPVVTADDPVEPIPVSPKNTDIANTTNPDSVDPNTNLDSLPG